MSNCDHDLEIVDDSFDHEYGCQQQYYYRCILCDATHEEDSQIPEQVDFDDQDYDD